MQLYTKPRSHRRFALSRQHLYPLALGALLGSALTYVSVVNVDVVGSGSSSSLALETTTRSSGEPWIPEKAPELQLDKADGWHTINVFFHQATAYLGTERQWFAQVEQDKIVVDLVGDEGYFVDLASNDARHISNTLALEQHGWNGLCIEPNPQYWYGLAHRKCTVVGALVGGIVEEVSVKFRGEFGGIVGKMDEMSANWIKVPDAPKERRFTAPLGTVLERFQVPKTIDYLSLDVEGAEHLVMQNFPFDQYTIKILTVERPSGALKKLLEQHGYTLLKTLSWWGETVWAHSSTGFTPEHPKIAKIKGAIRLQYW